MQTLPQDTESTNQQDAKPTNRQLFLIWTNIGLQSFGGGATTILLIQREFTQKHHWLTMDDFTHLWSLSLFAPGINLIAITILIGKKLGGITGIFCSLGGILVPSALITCLLAAGFQKIEHIPAVQAVFDGVVPATAGVMLLVGFNSAYPQLRTAFKESSLNLFLSIMLIAICATAMLFQIPVFIALTGTALLGILCFTRPLFKKKAETR
jgi:chromate transporter